MRNNLWKRFFRRLYSSSDFCRMKMRRTFFIFNWFVVYNSFRKRGQREIYIFDEKNIKRGRFLCKNELFRIQHSNDCSKTLLNRIRFSGYIFQVMRMRGAILRFNFRWRSFENGVEGLTLHDERASNDLIWTFHTSQHFALSSFLVVKSARTRSSAEIGISIEQSIVCFAVSQSVCNISKHQTFCLRQQTTVESKHFEKQTKSSVHLIVRGQVQPLWHRDNRQRASDDIGIGCSISAFIAEDVWSTSFRNRQSPACIWPFHGRMQQSDNQTIASAFDSIAIRCSTSGINRHSSDRGGAGCNVSDITDNCQCIWWHRHQMQFWQFHRQSSVHLMLSASGAACLASHSTASASDGIGIRCSNVLTSKSTACLLHSLIAASHSFDHFSTSSGTVDRSSYTFIWSSFS